MIGLLLSLVIGTLVRAAEELHPYGFRTEGLKAGMEKDLIVVWWKNGDSLQEVHATWRGQHPDALVNEILQQIKSGTITAIQKDA